MDLPSEKLLCGELMYLIQGVSGHSVINVCSQSERSGQTKPNHLYGLLQHFFVLSHITFCQSVVVAALTDTHNTSVAARHVNTAVM